MNTEETKSETIADDACDTCGEVHSQDTMQPVDVMVEMFREYEDILIDGFIEKFKEHLTTEMVWAIISGKSRDLIIKIEVEDELISGLSYENGNDEECTTVDAWKACMKQMISLKLTKINAAAASSIYEDIPGMHLSLMESANEKLTEEEGAFGVTEKGMEVINDMKAKKEAA